MQLIRKQTASAINAIDFPRQQLNVPRNKNFLQPTIFYWSGSLYKKKELKTRLNTNDNEELQLIQSVLQRWPESAHKILQGSYLLIYHLKGDWYAIRGVYDSPELFYSKTGGQWNLSLDLKLLLQHQQKPLQVSATRLAHQLAFQTNQGDLTPFKGVETLAAGQGIKISGTHLTQLAPHRPLTHLSPAVDLQPVSLWYQAVEEAIYDHSSDAPCGLLLSGGLDSGTLACHAADQQRPLQTLTISLPNFPDENESAHANHLSKYLGYTHHAIAVDSDCFDNILNFPVSIRRPVINPYQHMMNQAYQFAQSIGLKQLWTGSVGDDILSPKRYLLSHLWRDRHYVKLLKQWIAYAQSDASIPHLYRSLINQILRRTPRTLKPPKWLTASTRYRLPQAATGEDNLQHRSILFHYDNLYGLSYETEFSRPFNIERRHPFMHPATAAAGMSLAAYKSAEINIDKKLYRDALQGLAPDNMRKRKRVGVLINYYRHGWQKNLPTIREILLDKSAHWPLLVTDQALQASINNPDDDPYMLGLNCLALELWFAKLKSNNLSYEIVD